MVALLWLYFGFGQLAHPDWAVREAAHRRCDCLLGAVLAPAAHPDAEARRRVGLIRDRQLAGRRWLLLTAGADDPSARWRVQVALARDPAGWPLFIATHPLPPEVERRLEARLWDAYSADPATCPAVAVLIDARLTWSRPAVRGGLAALGGGPLAVGR